MGPGLGGSQVRVAGKSEQEESGLIASIYKSVKMGSGGPDRRECSEGNESS